MIPDEIKIGMRMVKVVYQDLGDLGTQGSLMGQYDPGNLTIILNSRMQSPALLLETFWHELVHAINDKIRFDFELAKEMSDGEDLATNVFDFEETFTEQFSQTLMQVIADNAMLPQAVPQGV